MCDCPDHPDHFPVLAARPKVHDRRSELSLEHDITVTRKRYDAAWEQVHAAWNAYQKALDALHDFKNAGR